MLLSATNLNTWTFYLETGYMWVKKNWFIRVLWEKQKGNTTLLKYFGFWC